MLSVMNDPKADASRRDRMAQAAAPFVHARTAPKERTQKDAQAEQAQAAAAGRFSPAAPPRLVHSK
jgi:hypothetical protein